MFIGLHQRHMVITPYHRLVIAHIYAEFNRVRFCRLPDLIATLGRRQTSNRVHNIVAVFKVLFLSSSHFLIIKPESLFVKGLRILKKAYIMQDISESYPLSQSVFIIFPLSEKPCFWLQNFVSCSTYTLRLALRLIFRSKTKLFIQGTARL